MFKKMFRKKSLKPKKKVQDNPKFHGKEDESNTLPANVKARREKSQKMESSKGKKKKNQSKSVNKSKKEIPKLEPDLKVEDTKTGNQTLVLKTRKKKGKKPKVKKTNRKNNKQKVGKVEKDKNKFYPGTVDFSYTVPKENWITCFGNKKDVDFGNKSRIIADETMKLL